MEIGPIGAAHNLVDGRTGVVLVVVVVVVVLVVVFGGNKMGW